MRYLIGILLIFTSVANAELLMYEGFEYDSTVLAENDGGFGFNSGWAYWASAPDLTGSSNLTLNPDVSLEIDSLPLITRGGCIEVPEGENGLGARFLGGRFGVEIDLDVNQEYYISYLFRRNDEVDGNSKEWVAVKLHSMGVDSYSDFLTIGTSSDESIYLDGIGGNVSTGPNELQFNTTYLFVVKIVANHRLEPAQSDQVFLKIYGPDDTVDLNDSEIEWTLVTGHDEYNNTVADFLSINGGSSTGYAIDEIRIGTTWQDVVPVTPPSSECLTVFDGFDYEASSSEDYDRGCGFNGPWFGSSDLNATGELNTIVPETSYSLQSAASKYHSVGGCLVKENLISGQAFRYLSQSAWIDLNTNSTHYFSCLIRRDDSYNGNSSEWSLIRFYKTVSDQKSDALTFSINSDESIMVDKIGDQAVSSPDILQLNETYLLVIKIVSMDDSQAGNYDQVFVKLYGKNETVSRNECSDWTLIGNTNQNANSVINLLQIASSEATGFSMDEIRLGKSWQAVIGASKYDPGNIYLDGDVNRDYHVDIGDLVIWCQNWLN